jgi:diguanylate cyclase (GGDEF)-like protein
MPDTTDAAPEAVTPPARRNGPAAPERLGAVIRCVVLLTVFLMTYWNRERMPGLDLAVGVGAIYVVLSTFPAIWGGHSWRERAIIFTSLDILLITWLVSGSGGMRSEFYMLYYLPVLQAGTRLDLRDAVSAALLSAVCYVLVWALTGSPLQVIQTTALLRMSTFAASAVVLALLLGLVSREIREERVLRARSQEALDAATTIYELTRAVGGTLDPAEMMRDLVAVSVDRLKADAGRALMVHPTTRELRVASVAGNAEAFFEDGASVVGHGLATWVRECCEPVLVSDRARRPELSGERVDWPEAAGSWLAAPLLGGGEVVGVLELVRGSRTAPFAPRHLDILAAAAAQAGVAVVNALRHEEVGLQAMSDPLTGLWNHGEFQARLAEEISRAQRHEHPVSLVLLDVDGFRQLNERYGHRAGDELLRQVASAVRRLLRGSDIPARYGGDDLAIILPQTTREGARVAADNLRKAIKERPFAMGQAPDGVSVTFSVGVAGYPEDGQSADDIVDAVARAMTAAKAAGGDRVIVHGEEPA